MPQVAALGVLLVLFAVLVVGILKIGFSRFGGEFGSRKLKPFGMANIKFQIANLRSEISRLRFEQQRFSLISIRGLRKWFDSRRGRVEALRGIDLEVTEKEFCVLLAPSGCGKTTTLRCVAGLERPDAGEPGNCRHRDELRGSGNLCPNGETRYRDGVSVLRDLAAHERV